MTEKLELIEVPSLIDGHTFKKLSRPLELEDFDPDYKADLEAFELFDLPMEKFKKRAFEYGSVDLSAALRYSDTTLNVFGEELFSNLARHNLVHSFPREIDERQREKARWATFYESQYPYNVSRCRKNECVREKVLTAASALIESVFGELAQYVLATYKADADKIKSMLLGLALRNAHRDLKRALRSLNGETYRVHKQLAEQGGSTLDNAGAGHSPYWRKRLSDLKGYEKKIAEHETAIAELRKQSEPCCRAILEERQEFLGKAMADYQDKHGRLPEETYSDLLNSLLYDRHLLPSLNKGFW